MTRSEKRKESEVRKESINVLTKEKVLLADENDIASHTNAKSTAANDAKKSKTNGIDKNVLPESPRKRRMKIDPDDNDIKRKTQKIVLMKSDYSKEKISLKKKKEKTSKDMLKPDLIKACKERRLPFIGTRAHLISALVRESSAANAVPGGEESRERCNAEKEARGCPDKGLARRIPKKILASQDHDAGSGSILEEEKLLQKYQKGRGDKVDLQMKKKRKK